jgi:hypothetical protein
MKLEPLSSHICEVSKKIYLPSSNVSIDEMIARFSGRSPHTFRIKNKPNPEGYKILSLCDYGYTYTFMFVSRIAKSNVEAIPNVNHIGAEVCHLVKQLPSRKAFNIFMDNYFSSINLFSYLRSQEYGACGTVRTNTANFPFILREQKEERRTLQWDYLKGVVVNNVLSLLWIDNGPVTMITTIHKIDGVENRIERNRRKPRETSANASKLKTVFGNQTRKVLPIPRVVDDYNHYMGGVDIADQLRSYYSTQLKVFRTWYPLFFWLLDTAIVNSFIISKKLDISHEHKAFRIQIVKELIKEATLNPLKRATRNNEDEEAAGKKNDCKKYRVFTKFELPEVRLVGEHLPEYREERNSCLWCRYEFKKTNTSKSPSQSFPRSQIWCSKCNVSLCCNNSRPNCFKYYHSRIDF